jgi:hypothetical protein
MVAFVLVWKQDMRLACSVVVVLGVCDDGAFSEVTRNRAGRDVAACTREWKRGWLKKYCASWTFGMRGLGVGMEEMTGVKAIFSIGTFACEIPILAHDVMFETGLSPT